MRKLFIALLLVVSIPTFIMHILTQLLQMLLFGIIYVLDKLGDLNTMLTEYLHSQIEKDENENG